MNFFSVNILLAIVWATLTADITLTGLLTGYVVGYGALWVAQPLFWGKNSYFVRVWRIIRLIGSSHVRLSSFSRDDGSVRDSRPVLIS